MHLNYCIIFSWRLFKLLCHNFQNTIHQTIPRCHCPFHLHFPFWLHQLLLHIHGKKKHIARALLTPFIHFSSRFSWSNLENFNFMDALYIWFLKSDIFGKYLWDVIGRNSWFRIISFLQICEYAFAFLWLVLLLHQQVDESLKQLFYQFVGTYQQARSCKNHKYIG